MNDKSPYAVHQTLDQFGGEGEKTQSPAAIRRRIYHLEQGDLVKWKTSSEAPEKAYDVIAIRIHKDRYIAEIRSNRGRHSILDPGHENGQPSIRHQYPSGTSSERLHYLKGWEESSV